MAKSKKKPAKKTAVKKKPAKKAVKKAVAKKAVAKKTAKPAAKKAATKAAPVKAAPASKKAALPANIQPLHDHILVQQEGESDRTPGGLFIPATAQDKPLKGRVLAIGKGAYNKHGKLKPLDVKVGETVLFAPYSGSKITVSGAEFLMIREEEILGVIKG